MHPEVRIALEKAADFLETNLLEKVDEFTRKMRAAEGHAAKWEYATKIGALQHILGPLSRRHSTSPILTDLRLSNMLTALTIVDRR